MSHNPPPPTDRTRVRAAYPLAHIAWTDDLGGSRLYFVRVRPGGARISMRCVFPAAAWRDAATRLEADHP